MFAQPQLVEERKQKAQIFMYIQCVSAVCGMMVARFARKSRFLFFANVLTFLLAGIGLYGCRKLHMPAITIHSICTVCGLCGLFVFQVFEAFALGTDTRDTTLLLLYSLPYMFDFTAGIFSVRLLFAMLEEEPVAHDPMELSDFNLGEGCVVCVTKSQNVLVYPCGHRCLCSDCALSARSRLVTCPICRQPIRDLVTVYDS